MGVNATYVKRGRRVTFLKMGLCMKQQYQASCVWEIQTINPGLQIWFCISAVLRLFSGVSGAKMHCLYVETIPNRGLLSLCFASISCIPSAETDDVQPQLCSEARSWHFGVCVHVVLAYVRLWPWCSQDSGAAILIKLQLTVCNLTIVISTNTIHSTRLAAVQLPVQLSQFLNTRKQQK